MHEQMRNFSRGMETKKELGINHSGPARGCTLPASSWSHGTEFWSREEGRRDIF